jgi:hypothetical protein
MRQILTAITKGASLICFGIGLPCSALSQTVVPVQLFALAAPPPVTAGVIPLDQWIHRELDRLPLGVAAFDPPSKMKQGRPELIQFRVASKELSGFLDGMRAAAKVERIRIAPVMSATLTGEEDAFRIVSAHGEGAADQMVAADEATKWSWEVTPRQSGTHHLHLAVAVYLFPPDGGPRRKIETTSRTVIVTVSPTYFFSHNWQGLLSLTGTLGGIMTVGNAILSWWRKRREHSVPRIQAP